MNTYYLYTVQGEKEGGKKKKKKKKD